MEFVRSQAKVSLTDVEDDGGFRAFTSATKVGMTFVPEPLGNEGVVGLKSDYGDFLKWLTSVNPEVAVTLPPESQKLLLRSADIWLPLVYLAGDTSVQVFLNMAASYLYDRAKGALKNERPSIHLSVVYEDKRATKTKRFDFTGDAEALGKAIKRFDLDNFFDDTTQD